MNDYVAYKVSELIKEYGTRDPYEILDALGVDVKYNYDFTKLKAFYVFICNNPYIVLNGNLNEYDLKTIAAHELGHHILHRELALNTPLRELGFYDVRGGPEYEANLFAAELLIDEGELIYNLKEDNDYFRICSIMRVSPELMAFKMNLMNNKRGYNFKIPIVSRSDFLAD